LARLVVALISLGSWRGTVIGPWVLQIPSSPDVAKANLRGYKSSTRPAATTLPPSEREIAGGPSRNPALSHARRLIDTKRRSINQNHRVILAEAA
jgi:hypothetical protein